jgi:hypothetical protein
MTWIELGGITVKKTAVLGFNEHGVVFLESGHTLPTEKSAEELKKLFTSRPKSDKKILQREDLESMKSQKLHDLIGASNFAHLLYETDANRLKTWINNAVDMYNIDFKQNIKAAENWLAANPKRAKKNELQFLNNWFQRSKKDNQHGGAAYSPFER